MMNNPFSVYIHIPFCAGKCAYCDFYSLPCPSEQTMRDYGDALCCQVKKLDKGAPESVYFGGGTPSLLPERVLRKITGQLREKFDLTNTEITIETNPESTRNILPFVKDKTFTRVSMGIQSLDDEQLRFLGRIHTSETARSSFSALRDAGADNISVDLICAIPFPGSFERLKRSLDGVISMSPEHVSVYMLSVEPRAKMSKLGIKEMDGDEAAEQYLYVSGTLRQAGFDHYEISNFARNGKRSRHNCGYWKSLPYIGIGAGAVGFDGIKRYRIPEDVREYIASAGDVPEHVEEILSETSLREERIILGLRTSDGIPETLIPEQKKSFADTCRKNGLARSENGRFSLTPEGWAVCNSIITEIIK